MRRHFFMGSGRFGAADGVAAPTLTGSPTLLASWDFDKSSTVTLSGADIDQISGADGTSYTQLTPGNMPAQSTILGKKAASFDAGSTEYMQIASALGVNTTNGVSIVLVVKWSGAAATYQFFDLSNGASSLSLNRYGIRHVNPTGFEFVKADGSGIISASVGGSAAAAGTYLLIGMADGGTGGNARLNVNGAGTNIVSGSTNNSPTGLSHATLGARRASNAEGLHSTVEVLTCKVYDGVLNATQIEEVAVWSNTNYGTTNAA